MGFNSGFKGLMCRLSWNLGASTSCNPQGLNRPEQACNGTALTFTFLSAMDQFGATHSSFKQCVHSSFQPNNRATAYNSMTALQELWFFGVGDSCRWHISTYKLLYRSVGRTIYRHEYLLRFRNSDCCPVCIKEMVLGHVSGDRPYTNQPSHISHGIGAWLTSDA